MRLTVDELISLLLREDPNVEVRMVMELESDHGSVVYSDDISISKRVGFLAVTGLNGH